MADKEIPDIVTAQGGATKVAAGDVVHVFRSPNSRAATLEAQLPATPASSSGPASMQFHEDTDNGSNKVTLQAPASIAADVVETVGGGKGSAIASGGTITIGGEKFYHVTGTTTITDIDFTSGVDGAWAWLEFDGALTLTHNATTLVLPGGANVVTKAGDRALVIQDSGDNVHVLAYVPGSSPPTYGPHVILEDQKSQNTSGGTFTSGADRTRDLNTEVYDPYGYCSLSSNQFTLPAGTWCAEWGAPAFGVGRHQSWLYNVSDSSVVARGNSDNVGTSSATMSTGRCVFTITASKTFEIRHVCQGTYATVGFGVEGNFGTEIYTRVALTKIA